MKLKVIVHEAEEGGYWALGSLTYRLLKNTIKSG